MVLPHSGLGDDTRSATRSWPTPRNDREERETPTRPTRKTTTTKPDTPTRSLHIYNLHGHGRTRRVRTGVSECSRRAGQVNVVASSVAIRTRTPFGPPSRAVGPCTSPEPPRPVRPALDRTFSLSGLRPILSSSGVGGEVLGPRAGHGLPRAQDDVA